MPLRVAKDVTKRLNALIYRPKVKDTEIHINRKKSHAPGGAGGTDHSNDGDHRFSHVEVLIGIELFVRRCLGQ